MGIDAALRINGPWAVEVDFPGVFDEVHAPESPEAITDSVEILTPPIPAYGAVTGTPLGLYVEGAGLRAIKLPVFEWGGYGGTAFAVLPLENQHYFALEKKFQGERFRTPRVTIGKIAVAGDVVACQMPVHETRWSAVQNIETAVTAQLTLEESVARGVFNILNGQTEHKGSYKLWEQIAISKKAVAMAKARSRVASASQTRRSS